MTDKRGSYTVFGSIAPMRQALEPIDLIGLMDVRRGQVGVKAYEPTLRDRIRYMAHDVASYFGHPDPRDIAGKVDTLADLAPLSGQALGGEDMGRAWNAGDWAGMGLAALGLAPGGKLVGKGVKKGADLAGDFASKLLKNMESRSAFIYDPPAKPPRPFEADYPRGVKADEAGRLFEDIDGRPLTAKYVVGRRVVGGKDETLSPEKYDPIAEAGTGGRPQAVASRRQGMGGDAGRYAVTRDRRSGDVIAREIFVDKSLPADKAAKVTAHEIGHMIDELSSGIPTDSLDRELRIIYNDLNNPQNYGKKFGPEQNRYKGEAVRRELMAEAIRAYMADPNYIKTVAPKTAARIREFVNSNPRLKDIIQFNSLGILATQTEREKGGGS